MRTRLRAPGHEPAEEHDPAAVAVEPLVAAVEVALLDAQHLARSAGRAVRPPKRAIAYRISAPARLPIVAASTARTNVISPWPT